MSLRGRIDRRIERLDEKKQALYLKTSTEGAEPQARTPVPVTGPAEEVEVRRPSPYWGPPSNEPEGSAESSQGEVD
jgi:hypothetical protein